VGRSEIIMTLQTVPLERFTFEEAEASTAYWYTLTFTTRDYFVSVPTDRAAEYFPRLAEGCKQELKDEIRYMMETLEDVCRMHNQNTYTHYSDGKPRSIFRDNLLTGVAHGVENPKEAYDALKSLYEML